MSDDDLILTATVEAGDADQAIRDLEAMSGSVCDGVFLDDDAIHVSFTDNWTLHREFDAQGHSDGDTWCDDGNGGGSVSSTLPWNTAHNVDEEQFDPDQEMSILGAFAYGAASRAFDALCRHVIDSRPQPQGDHE